METQKIGSLRDGFEKGCAKYPTALLKRWVRSVKISGLFLLYEICWKKILEYDEKIRLY